MYDYDEKPIFSVVSVDDLGRVTARMHTTGNEASYTEYVSTNQNVILEYTWYHLEIKVVFDDTTGGSVEVRINEVTQINQTGIQTYRSGGDSLGNYSFGQVKVEKGIHNSFLLDDFYVLDGEGSVGNDFIGDVRVDTIYPNTNGDYTNFDPEPSSNANWENVTSQEFEYHQYSDKGADYILYNEGEVWDGSKINFDTYNAGENTVRECYGHESLLSLNKPIYGLQTNSTFRKTDAGKKQVEQFVRISSTNYNDGRTIDVSDFARVYSYPMSVNPNTTIAWTESDINTIQSGIQIVT
jgi:hypothetical protein